MADRETVQLLWTGGWDSTFRLLEVLLVHGCRVQPWYLRDDERASSDWEWSAMQEVREEIQRQNPEAGDRLLPTRVVPVSEIEPNPEISSRYVKTSLGSQYDWLARFADQFGIEGLELSVEKRGSRLYKMLWPNVDRIEGCGGASYQLKKDISRSELELFRSFSFPILDRTKADLRREAASRGWEEMMGLTWFCHEPRDGRPCGKCTPCMITIQEGLGTRIPRLRRIRPRLRMAKAKFLGLFSFL